MTRHLKSNPQQPLRIPSIGGRYIKDSGFLREKKSTTNIMSGRKVPTIRHQLPCNIPWNPQTATVDRSPESVAHTTAMLHHFEDVPIFVFLKGAIFRFFGVVNIPILYGTIIVKKSQTHEKTCWNPCSNDDRGHQYLLNFLRQPGTQDSAIMAFPQAMWECIQPGIDTGFILS